MSNSFMGFETWYNNSRMIAKMQFYIIIGLTIIVAFICYQLYMTSLTVSQRSVIRAYYLSYIHNSDDKVGVIMNGKTYQVTYDYADKNYKKYVQTYLAMFKQKAKWALLIYLLLIPANIIFAKRAKGQSNSKFIRGAVKVEPEELNKMIKKKEKESAYLPIGQVWMPVSAEVKHCFIPGRPGVGKTVALSQILEKIVARNNRMIVHDFKGDYIQNHYRDGVDLIFNPLDSRSVYWNFFDEINSPIDVDTIGYALIPDAKGAGVEPFWNNAARDVLTGIINFLYRNNMKTYKDFYKMVTSKSDYIAGCLAETEGSEAGATQIADPESKQTGSIMSVMTQYTKIFAYMQEDKNTAQKTRFSLKKWLLGEIQGNIYISNYSDLQDTLAPILGLMVDLFSRKMLSLSESKTRRIFIILDEFGMLPKLQTIEAILTQGRSKGAGVFIGIQDLGQIEKTYGQESRKTIVNACGSSIVFAVADSDTAKILSEKYGDYIAIESFVNQSMGVGDNRDGVSISQQKQKEALVLPSEIIGLPDLTCYVTFPGYPVAQSKLTWKGFPKRNEPFVMRAGLSYAELLQNEHNVRNANINAQALFASGEPAAAVAESETNLSFTDTEEENNNWS